MSEHRCEFSESSDEGREEERRRGRRRGEGRLGEERGERREEVMLDLHSLHLLYVALNLLSLEHCAYSEN